MSATPVVLDETASVGRARVATRPMRVLQIISSVADVHGGASTAIWTTMEALRRRGVRADLVTTDEDGPGRRLNVPLGTFTHHGEHRVCYFPHRLDRYTTSWPMARWLLAHVRDYDVVHVHGLFRFVNGAAAYAAMLRNVPYVLTLHNTLGAWGMRNRRPLLKRLSIGLIEGRIIDRARKVHLCSADELRQVSLVRQLGARSVVFPLGADLSIGPSLTSVDTPEHESILQAFQGRQIVLFLSRIHRIKGLDRLLSAFAQIQAAHPEAVLVVAGSGDVALTTSLHEQARQLGIEQRIHWLGFVQGRLKSELLARAAVFVLPSHSENFGYAVVEALLAGLPVVTTDQVPSGEFVIAARAGIVCDGTPERLAHAITEMLRLPEETRRALGLRASSDVRRQLSLETFGESLEQLYNGACNEPSSLPQRVTAESSE
jgi:glycosyltransferase involved in cell wall biosynthesis